MENSHWSDHRQGLQDIYSYLHHVQNWGIKR